MITVADKPVALAGVMGGEATEISENSLVSSLKLLSSMANLSVRQVVVSTYALNHLHALKKGINVATVNEALDAAASMIAELAGATVRKGIVSAGKLDTSDVEVSSTLADVNRVLWYSILLTPMSKMSSVALDLEFLEC